MIFGEILKETLKELFSKKNRQSSFISFMQLLVSTNDILIPGKNVRLFNEKV